MGLSDTLDRLQTTQTTISRVSLHVPHFERRETIRAIRFGARQAED